MQPKYACKNKSSGKFFLFIEENNNETLLLATPTGEIKPLDSFLFDEIDEIDINYLLDNGLINQKQIDAFNKFINDDSVNTFKEIWNNPQNSEEFLKTLKTVQNSLSKAQYEFVFNRIIENMNKYIQKN